MKRFSVFATVILITVCFFLFRVSSQPKEAPKVAARTVSGKLRATITLSQPVVWSNEHGKLQISFKLVNESNEIIDPKIESWQVLANGASFRRGARVPWTGPFPMNARALPPGGSTGYNQRPMDNKPGDYTLRWEGDDFMSPPVKLRVY